MKDVLLEMRGGSKSYPTPNGKRLSVLRNLWFCIHQGEALGLLGPSGSGKSTIARIALGLERPDTGSIWFMGKQVRKTNQRAHFRRIGMVWQDPTVYLNPYQSVLTSIIEPMAAFDIGTEQERIQRAVELMETLGLPASLGRHKPGRLSGGQCQRVALARALAISPSLLICDEALVSLDLPQQVGILELLKRLNKEWRLGILFISHDRSTVRTLCHRALVLMNGTIFDESIMRPANDSCEPEPD